MINKDTVNIVGVGGSSFNGHNDKPPNGFPGWDAVGDLSNRGRKVGFARRIPPYLQAYGSGSGPSIQMFVDAEHGRTLPAVVNRLPKSLQQVNDRRSAERTVVVAMVGASDQRSSERDGSSLVSLRDFRESLGQLGKLCVNQGAELVFVGFHYIDDRQTMPVRIGEEDLYFSARRLQDYNQAVEEYAAAGDLPFIPTWDALGRGTEFSSKFVSEDKLHLNTAGHEALAAVVGPALAKIVLQR